MYNFIFARSLSSSRDEEIDEIWASDKAEIAPGNGSN